MSTFGYARVSTTDQKLEVQLSQLEAYGCDVVFQEKASGAKQDRPELAKLLNMVEKGDTIVVCKLDRIARSTKHLLSIVESLATQGVAFKALNADIDTSTATGKLMITVLGAIATFEREMMLERQKEGIEKAKTAGKYKGRKPTARMKAPAIRDYLREGHTKRDAAAKFGIGIASLYRMGI